MTGSHDAREARDRDGPNRSERGGSDGETERSRAAEERLRELRRENERLEELLGVLGHDLRNHLSVAKGRLDLARDDRDDEHLASVARSHDRMEELLDDLLDPGQDGGSDEAVSLETFARRAWATVETGTARLEVESDLEFRADRQRLSQLLENLFRNAVEHGTIHPQLPLTVTVGPLADGSGFYVEDDGRGLPPAVRERVFDEGFSTAEDGTGLGLAIVDDVAGGHGWSVTATEGSAGGARFEVGGVERSARPLGAK